MNNEEMGQYQPGEVKFIRLLPGPIERVWTYLTDSEKRGTWFAKGKTELRVGGRVNFLFHHADFTPEAVPAEYKGCEEGHNSQGKITQCDPPRLLAYTWAEEDGEESEVRFELTPRGTDVQLVLTHFRLPNRNYTRSVSSGWHVHLDVLAAQLKGEPVPPFWSRMLTLKDDYEKRLDAAFPKA
jgi:uncharacterized protein YndB with AHSA1/START domain